MALQAGEPRWFKSSASSVTGCVEVAFLAGRLVGVRDSQNPTAAPHVLSRRAWASFLAGAREGKFDPPAR